MKLQYIGTAAAEAIPAIFCECDVCRRCREAGGKSIRGRSGAVIDDRMMLDFPPDIYFQSLRLPLDLTKIEAILFTHSHCDHAAPAELAMRDEGCYCHLFGEKAGRKLQIYCNEAVRDLLREDFQREFGEAERPFYELTVLKAFETVHVLDYDVTPLPAYHALDEKALIYLISGGGKTLLYAHDTGELYDENYAYLEKNHIRLDMASLDCTSFDKYDGGCHMGLPNVEKTVARLREIGCVDGCTKLVVNHFSHNCADTHENMVKTAEPYGVSVSYDGMTVEI